MNHDTTHPEHGALLVAEIAADLTRVTLVDIVEQSYRLIARGASPSTFGPPMHDPTQAILAAMRQIEQQTSRILLDENNLIYPQNEAGNGVDGIVATTSAAGVVKVAVAGLAHHGSVRSAVHAIRSTYSTLLDTLALDEGGMQLGPHIAALARLKPEILVVVGGIEGGAVSPNLRLAHIVELLAQHSQEHPLIIFAGNSAAAEQVRETIGSVAKIEIVDNVLPEPHRPRLEPTRARIRDYYQQHYISQLPGVERLKTLRSTRIGSVVEDQGLMVRFLARRYNRNVLALTVDQTNTALMLDSDGHYSEAIFGRLGLRHSALEILQARGAAAIQRWLPFELDANELENRLLNRALRPLQVPTDLDDLLLDFALLREAANMAYGALRDERPEARYDLVIAGGGFVAAPRPGLAALALLDALQPTSADSELAISLYLDQFSLLAASGALAHLDTDAAACLLEQDALNNMPLATVIVPRSDLATGKKLAEVELTPTQGTPITRSVHAGDIVRLPLGRGKRATLRIRPVGGVAIGQNQPGTEVLSDEAAIVGSALGVIIDARPRPLNLPEDTAQRSELLLRWLNALDALPPSTAFAPTPPTDEQLAASSETNAANGAHTPGVSERTSTNGTHADEPVAVGINTDDVAALREGLVMQPKEKRSFWRRK